MGPGKLLFFGSKETHGCKNFENRTTFRYAHKRSKFYYITHLCEGVKKENLTFFKFFNLNIIPFFYNLKSISKMCSFDVEYVDAAQKMCG